ncbi:zinc finger protein ZFP2-like [Topomyia yanbarensis]|uniref:zinc finger protein ZFP2-like n=1 Tax=Topomyia yanbarensis TaxID=2498891 RepID=UPI00273C2116|nr:zinc finger protein ZFP2-like [Topomyia yanbarensis]
MASVEVPRDRTLMCRVCMENHRRMIPIFSKLEDAFIANIITECTTVQILEDDGLPEHICGICFDDLSYFVAFIKKTRKSDCQLRKMFISDIKQECDDLNELEEKYILEEEVSTELKSEESSDDNAEVEEETDYKDALYAEYIENESSNEGSPQSSSPIDHSPKNRRKRRKPSECEKTEEGNKFDYLDETERNTFRVVEVDNRRVCCSCLKLFNNVKDLKEHGRNEHALNRTFNITKTHVCQFCFRRYCSASALKLHHKKIALIKQVFDCVKCSTRFTASQQRRNHAHNHPEPAPKSSIVVASIPVKVQEMVGRICCAFNCNQVFQSDEELLDHSASAHKVNKVQSNLVNAELRPVECPICYKRFADENGLRCHQQRVYTPKRHICSICGQKFWNNNELERHEREHRNEKIFKCEQCPKAYYGKDRLKAHMKRHTATREYMCNICGQSYIQKHNLQTHMLMHEGKLPFECEVCMKAFRTKSKLVYHMRVHSGEKPYPCRYCDISFADSTNRLRHEMSHTGIKPYKCEYCEKTFITKRLKKEHESTHTGEKPYQCNICFVSFNQSNALKAHQALHTEII